MSGLMKLATDTRLSRSSIALLALLVSLAWLQSSPAAGRPIDTEQRVVEREYRSPALGVFAGPANSGAWYFDCEEQVGCVIFRARSGEKYLSVEVRDISGLPVYARVMTPGGHLIADVCEQTERPLKLRGTSEVVIHLVPGLCRDGRPSSPSLGTVVATFSNQR